jgi:8-oxo-dGTP pyrophosphatase MutT (NUDIX family)
MTGHPLLPDAASQDEIRDAACVVVIDRTTDEPKLLMGRRHADQVFLPGKWVFPGGRVDETDRILATRFGADYTPPGLAPEIRPFALAAVRELAEETGLVIGNRKRAMIDLCDGWRAFAATGYVPIPAHLSPLARAITPSGRVRRYDTWFFTAARSAVADVQITPDGELLDPDWFTLDEARKLDLPNITRLVLEDVALRLRGSAENMVFDAEKLPFYHEGACGFQRTLISCILSPTTP